eukprot:6238768-Prymnesium_polylepis.1
MFALSVLSSVNPEEIVKSTELLEEKSKEIEDKSREIEALKQKGEIEKIKENGDLKLEIERLKWRLDLKEREDRAGRNALVSALISSS